QILRFASLVFSSNNNNLQDLGCFRHPEAPVQALHILYEEFGNIAQMSIARLFPYNTRIISHFSWFVKTNGFFSTFFTKTADF
ncbi:MAG: hypothetical protein J6S28_00220, partial [Clostridia bacterium]|nr:hypothetical protein [Clostridia bacterium]